MDDEPSGQPGDTVVWSIVGSLLAGPLVWGGAGWGVDKLAHTSAGLPVGIVVGFLASMYSIYLRYGRG